ncbi:MAG: class I SAM-dependent methyltransferase [Deltaproteobacteria bacterium]|nr:class I SAM-dependent methyltransferase [Deltaproteobacteria bacterium]
MPDWDTKYASGAYVSSKNPGKLLIDLFPLLPKGKALDIACGEGRNAVFLAKNGYDVDAVDISGMAIERGREAAAQQGVKVNFIQADLENYRISEEGYDLIVNFNYLQRTLVPSIKGGLKRGGVVVFETFTLGQQAIGHPKNPEFLLKPNELLKLFEGLHIFFYREGIFEEERKKAIASLAGKRA